MSRNAYKDPIVEAWHKKTLGWTPSDEFIDQFVRSRLETTDLRIARHGIVHRVIVWQPHYWPYYYRHVCQEVFANGGTGLTLKNVTCMECLGVGG